VTLASLEIVLGIDNIVFIAVLTSKLPKERQPALRRIGILVAMVQRIILLFCISWVVKLTEPLFAILGKDFSGRDLILLGGGLFLLAKATYEIHGTMEGHGEEQKEETSKSVSVPGILIQILILDTVFSLDSVITAVGMVDNVAIMVIAVLISVAIMLIFANPISEFILRHPTVKILALSFLILVGVVLLVDGFGGHIQKGYIYFAMGFSIMVEMINFRMRARREAKAASA